MILDMTTHTVGDLASMAGITVRTLHHYDEIGLLEPSGRTASGYRLYGDADIERLRAILTYRELGLSLDETLEAVDGDAQSTLRLARDRVFAQIARLETIAVSLSDSLTENETAGDPMTTNDKLNVFGAFEPSEYAEEAESRWGDTTTYQESIRRTATYDADDWSTIREQNADIYARFAALMNDGFSADAEKVHALVEEHRAHISRWYYECSPVTHQGLGQMYAADPRFRKNIDKFGEGLAEYLSAAIAAAYESE